MSSPLVACCNEMGRDELDSLLRARRAEGRWESSGQFTIDLGQARQKLARYQLEQPAYYLQKILQGLVGLSPGSIVVRLGRRDILLEAGPVSPGVLDTLRPALADPTGAEDWVRDLAVGLMTSSSAGISEAEVTGYADGSGSILRISQEVTQERLDPVPESSRLYVRLERGEPQSLVERMFGWAGWSDEHHILSKAFTYTPVPVTLDGRSLQAPELGAPRGPSCIFGQPDFHLGERFVYDAELPPGGALAAPTLKERCSAWEHREGGWARRPFAIQTRDDSFTANTLFVRRAGRGEHCLAMLAIRFDLMGEASIGFVQHGLLTDTVQLDLGCPGVTGICSAHGLDTDLSQFRLVRNRAFDERIELLRRHVQELVADCHHILDIDIRLPQTDELFNAHLRRLPEPEGRA